MVWVRTSRKITIAAAPSRVWIVITDPAQYAALDSRARLLGAAGEPAMVGSNYTIEVTVGGRRTELLYTVTEAVPHKSYAYDMRVSERLRGQQEVRLEPTPDGDTLVRWSAAASAPNSLRS